MFVYFFSNIFTPINDSEPLHEYSWYVSWKSVWYEMKANDFMFSHSCNFYLASALVSLSVSKGKKGGRWNLFDGF